MIRPEHVFCASCGYEAVRRFDPDRRPRCPRRCGVLRIDISKWEHAPATDVCGSTQVSQVLSDAHGRDLEYTSARERDRKMREQGFIPAGDLVGGARTVMRPTGRPRRRVPVRRGWNDGDGSQPAA